jgi:hypothetical protein
VSGFQSFATAFSTPATTMVVYTLVDGTAWEVGQGLYTLSGTTLSRLVVYNSSAGVGTKISLSGGTTNVWCDLPAAVIPVVPINAADIALLRWDAVQLNSTYIQPSGLAPWVNTSLFDGTNIWMGSSNSPPQISVVNATTQVLAATIVLPTGASWGSGSGGGAMCFDGVNVWATSSVTDGGGNTLYSINATTFAVTSYAPGLTLGACCWDGTNIWAVRTGSRTLCQFTTGGSIVSLFSNVIPTAYESSVSQMIFDGTNIWCATGPHAFIVKTNAGSFVGTYATGGNCQSIAFDGNNIWCNDGGSQTFTLIVPSSGSVYATYTTASADKAGLTFDGTYMWCIDEDTPSVQKFIAWTGTQVGQYPLSLDLVHLKTPSGLAFDGQYIWAGTNSGYLFKMKPR